MASEDTVSWPVRVAGALMLLVAAGALAWLVDPVAVPVVVALLVQFVVVSRTAARVAASARAGAAVLSRLVLVLGVALRTLLLRVAPAAVGTLALVVALDWGVGTVWDRASGTEVDTPAPADLVGADFPPVTDERLDSPAMAGSPWAERYFQEFEAARVTYLPVIGPREAPVHGRYINSAEGIRRSYEPPGAGDQDTPTVWFFGGSTLWGEGQRDLHTIPSQVARLAEVDGMTLRVVNYGIRGYTAFQEFLVFEQELARRERPDLAVFYHGANEIATVLDEGNLSPQPSIFQTSTVSDAFDRSPTLPGETAPPEPSVAGQYVETSGVHKLWRSLHRALEDPAGAEEPRFEPTDADFALAVDEAAQIYRRSITLIGHVAGEHDVPTLVLWQPTGIPPSPPTPDHYRQLGDLVADLNVDISDALAGAPPSIYLDGLHTNEEGARRSAEAIWRHLRPAVEEAARP